MIRREHFYLAYAVLCLAGCANAASSSTPQMPFSFVENRGQAAPDVRYIGNGPQFKAWFLDGAVTLQQGQATTRMRFEGGASHPHTGTSDPIGATANYFRGGDRSSWKTGLPMFRTIRYHGVWPGIEVRFKAENSQAKAEYVVAPGASPGQIRLRFDGDPKIQSDGSLVVTGDSGEFREDKPFIFQEAAAGRTEVQGAFWKYPDGSIGFTVAEYDHSKPLVIDPPILFSGYFGGSSQSNITSVAVNSAYNIIVAGWTISTDLPTSGGPYASAAGGVDAFVAGFSPAGGSLLFCTYLGGSGDDRAFGLAVDASNNSYITGWTSSANFPVFSPYQAKLKGARDAFVTKLNPTGSALIYSTYLGGAGVDTGNAISLDATNAAVVVGDTTSTNLPVTVATFQTRLSGGQDVFIAKLTPSGAALSFLTYFGGAATDHATAVKLDSTGAICFGGSTYSANLPLVHAAQSRSGGGQDAFVAKLVPGGTSLIFSTYLGGSGGSPGAPEQLNGLALSTNDYIFVAGVTSSPDFPISSVALQKTYGGGLTDGFMARYDSLGNQSRSTFFGGSLDDSINAIIVDFNGYIHFTGYTTSNDIPTQNPVQNANAGAMDTFVAKGNFSRLVYSTYLGGSGNDSANAIALDSLSNVVVAGSTSSGNFPVVGNLGATGGVISSFITKLTTNFNIAVAAGNSFYFDVWHTSGYNGTLNTSTFGNTGDIPVSGDWDGTGRKRIGVFRNGTWLLDINGNGVLDAADRTVSFGQAGDIPVVGDWNGTGRIKLGLYRQGTFILDLSGHLSGSATGLNDLTFAFGLTGDLPVALDWNRSGTTKVGVFRNGTWLVDYSGTQSPTKSYTYGVSGDVPVTGDWDGSGLAKIGVYRHGIWILDYDGDNSIAGTGQYELYFGFGGASYTPLVY